MLAAKKEEQTIGGMPEARLEFHFDNWRRWMRHDGVTDGYPGKAAGCVGGGLSQTFDDMVDAADTRCACIVDGVVNSLSPVERSAIYHKYLYAVFRFPRGFEEAIAAARLKVAGMLVARGVY